MRRVGVAGAVVAVTIALSSCGNSPITAAQLDAIVGPTFARLYADQQHRLGHALPARGPDGRASCTRGAGVASPGATPTGTGTAGAGDDWSCAVDYPFADGHVQPIVYEVTVAPTGCFTADGPPGVVGAQSITSADGTATVNPLFAFDGCLDT